jgi:hypothetical protein
VGGGQSRATVLDGGANGFVKANIGTGYKAPYSPNPHIVRLGRCRDAAAATRTRTRSSGTSGCRIGRVRVPW